MSSLEQHLKITQGNPTLQTSSRFLSIANFVLAIVKNGISFPLYFGNWTITITLFYYIFHKRLLHISTSDYIPYMNENTFLKERRPTQIFGSLLFSISFCFQIINAVSYWVLIFEDDSSLESSLGMVVCLLSHIVMPILVILELLTNSFFVTGEQLVPIFGVGCIYLVFNLLKQLITGEPVYAFLPWNNVISYIILGFNAWGIVMCFLVAYFIHYKNQKYLIYKIEDKRQ